MPPKQENRLLGTGKAETYVIGYQTGFGNVDCWVYSEAGDQDLCLF